MMNAQKLIALADRAVAESDFTIPADVMDAMLAGKSPVVAWREHRRMSQDALADAVGMLQPALARIEGGTGRPCHVTIDKLADALGVPGWRSSCRREP